MSAYRADLGSLLADHNVAAVAALPDRIAFLGEYQAVLHIRQKLSVSLLMLLLDSRNAFEQSCDLLKSLFSGFLSSSSPARRLPEIHLLVLHLHAVRFSIRHSRFLDRRIALRKAMTAISHSCRFSPREAAARTTSLQGLITPLEAS